jgi:hypothetical protein
MGSVPIELPLKAMIDDLETYDPSFSFGSDIDKVHEVLFGSTTDIDHKHEVLRNWLARHQPCLFGRLAAKGLRGINFDVCWIDESDLNAGDAGITAKIQRARREWKDRAAAGLSHGFLVMFNLKQLAYAKPGEKLVDVCRRISNLYLIEGAPVALDTIYTEAMPLKRPDGWFLFKAGTNVFYTGAHRTLNHDRRVPGGVLISVNSPGHLANSLVLRGLAPTFETAVDTMLDLALRSIGNGGIGHDRASTTSWHNESAPKNRCPIHRSDNADQRSNAVRHYSAMYHSDVLVPAAVTRDPSLDPLAERAEIWPWLIIDYINTSSYPATHVNYALFRGHPIPEEAKYFNPWPPRLAENHPLRAY